MFQLYHFYTMLLSSYLEYTCGDNRSIVVENNYLVTHLIQIYIGFLDYFVILEFMDSELQIVQWFINIIKHTTF
jgi:hypothetical protein